MLVTNPAAKKQVALTCLEVIISYFNEMFLLCQLPHPWVTILIHVTVTGQLIFYCRKTQPVISCQRLTAVWSQAETLGKCFSLGVGTQFSLQPTPGGKKVVPFLLFSCPHLTNCD